MPKISCFTRLLQKKEAPLPSGTGETLSSETTAACVPPEKSGRDKHDTAVSEQQITSSYF